MNILLWVLQVLAAFLYGASGVMKAFMFDKVSEGVPSFGESKSCRRKPIFPSPTRKLSGARC